MRCGDFLPFLFLLLCKEDGGGIGVLRLDDRTLHVYASGFLGTELGGASSKGRKPNSCYSPFVLDAAG